MTEKEINNKQHIKELKSLRNKMGPNIIWFDSLNTERQFDLLFEWKVEKYTNKLTTPTYTRVWIDYPPSLKHFIKGKRKEYKYLTNIVSNRNSAINILLNDR